MESLPLEITENILSRLPIALKSQSREVCKTWRTLIPKPKRGLLYGISHREETKLEAQFYFSEQNTDKVDDNYVGTLAKLDHAINFNFFQQPAQVQDIWTLPSSSFETFMVGSCHGLVCYAAYASYTNQSERITVYICNPFTGEKIQLPTAYSRVTSAEKAIGFGYNHSRNGYKVVRILLDANYHQDGTIKVYTLQGDTAWRKQITINYYCETFFKPHLGRGKPTPSVGVFAGGALNWIGTSNTVILSFDLEHETLNLLPSSILWCF
ncbi:F-box/kelch-repeat protein At3g23880-like [Papaver somniferum]|uniref:F-box/kelch-repeat protein At3g23880-like n=1 Tax=Papaver somniferum TaxID=3469 RepID=UPI000E6FE5B3|nr:F-box/kelch-repeat protein At3g23880-like [Papaver somniferum]